MFDAPPYTGPATDHFDGRRFSNQDDTAHEGFGSLVKWMMTRDRGPFRRIEAPPGPPPPAQVEGDALRVTLVNHATCLVQTGGLNVLTDPVWSDRIGPYSWAGPKRFRPPGVRFEDLPKIDLVLLSHNHYDHLDVPTLRRLHEEHAPNIVTGLGNVALLERHGIGGGVELDWWEATESRGVRITASPARHFSGRGTGDRDRTLWCALTLHGPAGDVYFAGDTGMGAHFSQVRERLGAPRLALLPIGAYRPTWFMRRVHVSPAEALEAHRTLGADTSVAIHYGTFQLADDGQDEPVLALEAALGESSPLEDDERERFLALEHGVGHDVA